MIPRLLALAGLILACGGGFDDALNVPPLERYTDRLIEASRAPVARSACGMFAASRAGWCRVQGVADELPAFVAGLSLRGADPAAVYGDQTCLVFAAFGRQEGSAHVLAPGVGVYAPGGPLPENTDNVVLRRVYVTAARDEACLEYEYPYG